MQIEPELLLSSSETTEHQPPAVALSTLMVLALHEAHLYVLDDVETRAAIETLDTDRVVVSAFVRQAYTLCTWLSQYEYTPRARST